MPSNCDAGEDSLTVLWTAKRSKQSILKEINPEDSLEGLMVKLKLQNFGHLMQRADSLEKTMVLGCWERLKEGGEGMPEDEMLGWHHRLNGHEFEHTLGDSEGQGILSWCAAVHGVAKSQTPLSD